MSAIEIAGWCVTCVAIVGVVLNNRRSRTCFVLWVFSNATSACIHIAVGLWSLAVRDLTFFGLAIAGWFMWGRK